MNTNLLRKLRPLEYVEVGLNRVRITIITMLTQQDERLDGRTLLSSRPRTIMHSMLYIVVYCSYCRWNYIRRGECCRAT